MLQCMKILYLSSSATKVKKLLAPAAAGKQHSPSSWQPRMRQPLPAAFPFTHLQAPRVPGVDVTS